MGQNNHCITSSNILVAYCLRQHHIDDALETSLYLTKALYIPLIFPYLDFALSKQIKGCIPRQQPAWRKSAKDWRISTS